MRQFVNGGLTLGVVAVVTFALVHPSRLLPSALAADASKAEPALSTVHCEDRDGDGFGRGCLRGDDCNDLDAAVHPGQLELCNFRDDDCNAQVDDAMACAAPSVTGERAQVPAGEFNMGSAPGEGSADEQPRHRVWLSAFDIDRFEVTNRRYRACVKAGRCEPPQMRSSHLRSEYFDDDRFSDYPVIFVDKSQAAAFCEFSGGRLPTEAEWEKAARGAAPSINRYPWGDREPDCSLANLGGQANCLGDTDRVGRRTAGQSPFGLMDMAGNVWEWVADWYDADYYRTTSGRDPKGPAQGSLGIVRGGCWESGADSLRVSCRKPTLPSTWAYNVGFRCAYTRGR
jgi:formylglycine-generating enzyme required for sulfatase activity